MPPKKEKKGAEPDPAAKKGGLFTEVEKTFLEVQLADANRKVGRLRLAVDEYEVRNEELQKAYDKLDEDRADIIAYLKKTLNVKNEENAELKDKVKGLKETREIETAQFKETIQELENNFTTMKDQLTSENKLLAGKLNTLEEFRAIRDDLMRKYEKQEQDFKDQKMKYKRIIYDAEKKFVIGKDKLKKEMEGRLLQLAQDFQDATELRIAASTHRVIRENIAINNELDRLLQTQSKLADQNEKYKESCIAARVAMELAEEERDKAINKNVVQLKVIDQLTTAFQTVKKERALFEKRNFDIDTLQNKIQKLTKENSDLSLTVRILEQNLHGKLNDQNKVLVEASKIAKESAKLKKILKEAAITIQAALKLDDADKSRVTMDREDLLTRLLDIVTQYREGLRAESMDTLASLGKVYEEGDLGFVPKRPKKSVTPAFASAITSQMSIGTERLGSASITISTASLSSIKTIPSVQIVPVSSDQHVGFRDSLPSFITSTKSSVSKSAESVEEEEDDIAKQLAASKAKVQESIMKDLVFSLQAKGKEVKVKSSKTDEEEVEEEEGGEKEEVKDAEGVDAEEEGVEEEETASEKDEAGVQDEEDEVKEAQEGDASPHT